MCIRKIIQKSSKMIRKGACQIASSIHSNPCAEVHEVPMNVIIRPFPAEVNEEKVQSLINALKNVETEHTVPPIDVLWIKGTEGEVVKVTARKVVIIITLLVAVIVILPINDWVKCPLKPK